MTSSEFKIRREAPNDWQAFVASFAVLVSEKNLIQVVLTRFSIHPSVHITLPGSTTHVLSHYLLEV